MILTSLSLCCDLVQKEYIFISVMKLLYRVLESVLRLTMWLQKIQELTVF